MSNQLVQDGEVIKTQSGVELECTVVTYRERDGVKENFTYSFRPKAEMDEERENARKVAEANKVEKEPQE